ncbi:MAG: class I SAM-dependent methyltransferase [Methanobacterium sp.]|jgi:SAM-dependent methyltransferase|uniref:methyltransferase domain-containing protein n=1 Tax=Methanobacterium sp. TaxID=2164 RepID=UPI00258E2E92|nr:class I SAM-dependent methyltransferase [Methanobacterium sp.]MCC7560866.1 class I SAM-dependent methyltransferase [Methanobacterium sp.]
MEFITKEDIESINDPYFEGRFRYLKEVIHQIKNLDNIKTTLELGPYKSPLIRNGDVIDITDNYLSHYPIEIGEFFTHDCSITPYPFEDKKYDLIVACQVLEHLGRNQKAVFKEFARIGKVVIITLPYKWNVPCDVHHMIDEKIIDEWSGGVKPVFQKIINGKILRIYNFGNKNIDDSKKFQEFANFQLTGKLINEKKKIGILESELKKTKDLLLKSRKTLEKKQELFSKKQNHIKMLKNQIESLNQELDDLNSHLYECKYYNNENRSLFQRLTSKFYFLYILLKSKNDIKNVFNVIKGYRTIKNKHMLDIGYYLKNNNDVKVDGMDPLLHYIYYGYNEGRKPNPKWDDNFCLNERDVKDSGLNPLVYYAVYIEKE